MNIETLMPLSQQAQELKKGIYEHYKGLPYQVLAVARHSEDLEEYVVYQALYGEYAIWIRPLEMFLEMVTYNGHVVPRFSWRNEAP